jgi:acyl carrier protein
MTREPLESTARDHIEDKVRELVAEQLGIADDDILTSSSFSADLGADTLDILEVVMAVEEEFEVDIPEVDAEAFVTILDLVSYISKREQN